MKRITYMSKFRRAMSPADLAMLGKNAAESNAKLGITGVLLTIGDTFYQVIEGDDAPINELFARIRQDGRHTDVVCIRTENGIDARRFPKWNMRTINLDEESGEVVGILKLLLGNISSSHLIAERYMQPTVSRLMRLGLNPLELPARRAQYVVMFADIVGFTQMTRKCAIEDVVQLVNTALSVCSETVIRRGGELTKFLGDGLLAYWPIDCADEAIEAALDCLRQLGAVRAEGGQILLHKELYMGFGLSAGELIEGNIGYKMKTDFTIIGDAVNVASRVEGLTRKLGRALLVTAAVPEHCTGGREFSSVGYHELDGVQAPQELFTVTDSAVADFPAAV